MDWKKFNDLKILIVDDDLFTRELIKTMLKKIPNLVVDQAIDGLEASLLVKKNEYDMLLIDLYMPRMNGNEFITSLNKQNQHHSILTVLITTDRLSRKELKEIGANYCLKKPFDFDNFLSDIYGFLEEKMLDV